jgi:hypothetical protein
MVVRALPAGVNPLGIGVDHRHGTSQPSRYFALSQPGVNAERHLSFAFAESKVAHEDGDGLVTSYNWRPRRWQIVHVQIREGFVSIWQRLDSESRPGISRGDVDRPNTEAANVIRIEVNRQCRVR